MNVVHVEVCNVSSYWGCCCWQIALWRCSESQTDQQVKRRHLLVRPVQDPPETKQMSVSHDSTLHFIFLPHWVTAQVPLIRPVFLPVQPTRSWQSDWLRSDLPESKQKPSEESRNTTCHVTPWKGTAALPTPVQVNLMPDSTKLFKTESELVRWRWGAGEVRYGWSEVQVWWGVLYPAQARLSQQSPEGGVVLGVAPQVSTHMIQLLPPVTWRTTQEKTADIPADTHCCCSTSPQPG